MVLLLLYFLLTFYINFININNNIIVNNVHRITALLILVRTEMNVNNLCSIAMQHIQYTADSDQLDRYMEYIDCESIPHILHEHVICIYVLYTCSVYCIYF